MLYRVIVNFVDGKKSSFVWNAGSAEEMKQRVIDFFPHAMPLVRDVQVIETHN